MKNRKTYKILTYCSLFFPLNRFYIGDTKGLFWRSVTGNYIFFGWIGDLMYTDKAFDEAMAKRGFINTNIRNEQNK